MSNSETRTGRKETYLDENNTNASDLDFEVACCQRVKQQTDSVRRDCESDLPYINEKEEEDGEDTHRNSTPSIPLSTPSRYSPSTPPAPPPSLPLSLPPILSIVNLR